MKYGTNKLRRKILLYILPISVIAMILISIFAVNYAKRVLNQDFEKQKNDIAANVTNTIKLIDSGYLILEQNLEVNMEAAILEFKKEFSEAGGDPENVSLESIKENIKLKIGENYDLMIIDKATTIIKSTTVDAMNFNFMDFDLQVGAVINEVRLSDEIRHERIRTNVATGFLNKFSYIASEDHEYVLEIAYQKGGMKTVLEDLDPFIQTNELIKINPIINVINIYDVFGYEFVNGGSSYKPTEESLAIVSKVKKELNYEISDHNLEKRYLFINLDEDGHYMTDSSKIVEIIYDKSSLQNTLNQLSILIYSASCIVAFAITIVIYLMSKRITHPITILSNVARRVAIGDYDVTAIKMSSDEIGELTDVFNTMVKEIKNNFKKIEKQNSELEGYSKNLENMVEERTLALANTLEESKKTQELLKESNIQFESMFNNIQYLSYHDQLTGLYNRRYWEEMIEKIDREENYPLSMVLLDVNGLKMINDAFGHSMGDKVLQKTADIMKSGCREEDIVARIGGDEFIIMMPRMNANEVEAILQSMVSRFETNGVGSVYISVSYGWGIKENSEDKMSDLFKIAEDHMYRRKLSESKSMRYKTIEIILRTLHEKSEREKLHSDSVSLLCERIGTALGLDIEDVKELKTAGLMHDIGKIAIDLSILDKPGSLTAAERIEIERHPEQGYQILRSIGEFAKIAEYVLAHHERWDGTGYPGKLKGDEIPLEARIIAIADSYHAMISDRPYRKALSKEEAIGEIKKYAGIQFDPSLAKLFVEKVVKEKSFDGSLKTSEI